MRIFLNTHGKNPDEVSPELVELLKYIENTTAETAQECNSERIHKLQERVQAIKSSEEVSVKYMQEWEERELERRDAREEGIEQGIEQGQEMKLKELIAKKLSKGKTLEMIVQELEESVETIRKLIEL